MAMTRGDTSEFLRRKVVIEQCLTEGYAPQGAGYGKGRGSAVREASRRLKVSQGTLSTQIADGKIVPNWDLFSLNGPIGVIPAPAAPITSAERVEITGLKDKVTDLQRLLKEADRELLSETAVREQILALAAHTPAPPAWLIATPSNPHGIAGIPIVDCSDWHAGEVVKLGETNGANEFNLEIAERRIRNLIERVIDLCFNHMTGAIYPGIVMNLGGDLISGKLHPELAETDELNIFPLILWVLDRLIWCVDRLLERFNHVHIPCVPGNHGRVLDHKPHHKRYVYRNADWLLYSLLEKHYKDKGETRVTFQIPESGDVLFRIYNHTYMSVHGDDLGVAGGDGIIGAIGPIMRGEHKIQKSEGAIGRGFDTLIVHHYHQRIWLPNIMVNNSLKGPDEYSRRKLRALPTEPSQNLWFTHPKYGITACWDVRVGDKPLPDTAPWLSFPS